MISKRRHRIGRLMQWVTVTFIALLAPAAMGADESGVSETEIVLGQSCALTGPARELGLAMRTGLEACLERVNRQGGIRGRTVRLVCRDDGYEPDRAVANTRELIDVEKVFLLIGEVGTPTSNAVLPLIDAAEIPFIGPFTGAEFLRDPFRAHVINIRGSYFQETEKLVEYLVDLNDLSRIACFYQDDGFGAAGLLGVERALQDRGLELAARGAYERNTTAIKGGLIRIRRAAPEAVILIGAYEPCAAFIRLARRFLPEATVYCNISFVGTGALNEELGEQAEGCIVSQVVLSPDEVGIAVVDEFNEAMDEFKPDAPKGYVALEGYLAGKLFAAAAAGVQGNLTRESFLAHLYDTGVFDLGGIELRYGPGDNQGMDEVFLTVLKNGEVVSLRPALP